VDLLITAANAEYALYKKWVVGLPYSIIDTPGHFIHILQKKGSGLSRSLFAKQQPVVAASSE
jgi:hypothetical protein